MSQHRQSNIFCSQASIIPVRSTPMHYAEQVSQILYGETFVVNKKKHDWFHITCEWDQYTGWIHSSGAFYLRKKNDVTETPKIVVSDFAIIKHLQSGKNLILSAGSQLHPKLLASKIKVIHGKIDRLKIRKKITPSLLSKITKNWLGTPYQWGGRSRFGIDCSGFTQVIFSQLNIQLPRDSHEQFLKARSVIQPDEKKVLQPGDLIFFGNKMNKISHVGMMITHTKLMHASGQVRINHISNLNKSINQRFQEIPQIVLGVARYF